MGFNSQIRPLATPERLFTENRFSSVDFRNRFALRNGLIHEYSFLSGITIYRFSMPLIPKIRSTVTRKTQLRPIDVMSTGHLSVNMAVYFKTMYLALTSTYL